MKEHAVVLREEPFDIHGGGCDILKKNHLFLYSSTPADRAGECARAADGTYLVDPASSHMLVSKAKPCTCKHRPPQSEAVNDSSARTSASAGERGPVKRGPAGRRLRTRGAEGVAC